MKTRAAQNHEKAKAWMEDTRQWKIGTIQLVQHSRSSDEDWLPGILRRVRINRINATLARRCLVLTAATSHKIHNPENSSSTHPTNIKTGTARGGRGLMRGENGALLDPD